MKLTQQRWGSYTLTSCSLPPSIVSRCDNRDIPELGLGLTTGLSLNSSEVRGMLDWRAGQPEANRREEMNINKLRFVMARSTWLDSAQRDGAMKTLAKQCAKLVKANPYVAVAGLTI